MARKLLRVVRKMLRIAGWLRKIPPCVRRAAVVTMPAVLLPALASGAVLTRGPYLQLLSTHGVTIVWDTDVSVACAVTVRPIDGTVGVVPGGTGAVCAVAVDGLIAGTAYAYALLADGVPLAPEAVFRTDDPLHPFTFLVLGDSGGGGAPQYAVRDRMLASPVDFLLHTGDMIYLSGAAADFDPKFFAPYGPLASRVVFWPCLGNHDFRTAAGQPWRDAFYTPANNSVGSENYYSFDYGNAHVVVLDSNESTAAGSAQYTFLDQDLAASRATWKFVAFHHTIYSTGDHGSNLTIRANLTPLFDQYGVDMVFMGHDHDYERTKPLRANRVVLPGAGTVYVTTGGGGESVKPVGTSTFTAYAEATFHFTRVSVTGTSLLLQMIRSDGAIRDTLSVVKGGAALPVVCGDDLVDQAGEQCDGVDHTACRAGCLPDCTCAPTCGDGRVNQPAEACDGGDDTACPGLCRADCTCGVPAQFVTLSPTADTYIEAGTEASWDHGAGTTLDVDQKPFGVAYLKFDLSGIPVSVTHAALTLAGTNTSVDGGTAYPVASSSWVEGTRTGVNSTSASGLGLKWNDVDTNRDGLLDASDSSPYVPDWSRWFGSAGIVIAGHPVTIDVTGAFQQGPGLYSIAFRNDSTDGTTYASRESAIASQRPRLRLELGGLLTTTTTSSTTSTTGLATTTSSSTSTTRPPTTTSTSVTTTTSSSTTTTAPRTVIGVTVADVSVREKSPGTNFGTSTALEVDGRSGRRKRAFLRFSVTGVGTKRVTSARLRLQVSSASGGGGTVSGGRIHRIGSCTWNELAVTWANQPAIGPVLDTVTDVTPGTATEFDVTAAVPGDGVYCFAIESALAGSVSYTARESSPPPRLVVQLAP